MLRYNRKNKNLRIPVGIGTNNNVDSSLLFNVSDGDATAGDLIAGKTAYSAEGFLVGTLDLEGEKTSSYNEGYLAGEQDGYVSGEADGYADGYAEGKEDGIEEILTEQSDANITPGSVLEGYIGYGANNERIVGTNVGGYDFSEIGYTSEESNECNVDIKNDIAYSKQLLDKWNILVTSPNVNMFKNDIKLKYLPFINMEYVNYAESMFYWCINLSFIPQGLNTSGIKSMSSFFNGCSALKSVPLFDTSKVTSMGYMFYNCKNLISVPLFDTSKVTSMDAMFYGCQSLKSIPQFNTSNVTTFYQTFRDSKIENIPLLDAGNVTNCGLMFRSVNTLENLGGFKDLGKSFTGTNTTNHTLELGASSNLTRESLLNVFNNLYDMNLTSVTDAKITIPNQHQLTTEDLAIATNKGWTIQ